MSDSRPQTSTVREALAIAQAAEEILDAVHPTSRVQPVAEALADIIARARTLNAYQIDDVLDHIDQRASARVKPADREEILRALDRMDGLGDDDG